MGIKVAFADILPALSEVSDLGYFKSALSEVGKSKPSAAQLQPESGKTMQGMRVAGHRELLQKLQLVRQQAQKISSPGFDGFAAQRPVRQRSLAADLTFWLLLGQAKSDSPRGN
jgi:hypothetical protein